MLTVHDHAQIVDETVDDLDSFSRGNASLVLCESIKPLQDRLNILLTKEFLDKFYYVTLSKVLRQQERTHSIVVA